MEVLTTTLVEAVFTVVGILIAAAVSYFAPKVKRQLERWQDDDELGIVTAIVDMGVELAEKELDGANGEKKFDRAAEYVALMANRYGINVTDEFIKGAVQAGWRRMDAVQNKERDDK